MVKYDKGMYLKAARKAILEKPCEDLYLISNKITNDMLKKSIELAETEYFDMLYNMYSKINTADRTNFEMDKFFQTLNPDFFSSEEYLELAKNAIEISPKEDFLKVFKVINFSALSSDDYLSLVYLSLNKDKDNISKVLETLDFKKLNHSDIKNILTIGITNSSIEELPNILNVIKDNSFSLTKKEYKEFVDMSFSSFAKDNSDNLVYLLSSLDSSKINLTDYVNNSIILIPGNKADDLIKFLIETEDLNKDSKRNFISMALGKCNNPELFIENIFYSNLSNNDKFNFLNKFLNRCFEIDSNEKKSVDRVVSFIDNLNTFFSDNFQENITNYYQEVYKELISESLDVSSIKRYFSVVPEILINVNKEIYDETSYKNLVSKSFFSIGNHKNEIINESENSFRGKEIEEKYNNSLYTLLEYIDMTKLTPKSMIAINNNIHTAVTKDFVDKIDSKIVDVVKENSGLCDFSQFIKAFNTFEPNKMNKNFKEMIFKKMPEIYPEEELFRFLKEKNTIER